MQEETEANYKRLMRRDLENKIRQRLEQRNTSNKGKTQTLPGKESTKKITGEVSKEEQKLEVGKKLVFFFDSFSLFYLIKV